MLILKVNIKKKISPLFILVAIANLDLFALHVNLTGPTEVCPGIDYIYTVYIETNTHINVTNTVKKIGGFMRTVPGTIWVGVGKARQLDLIILALQLLVLV
jgi:hypothetical protein